MDFWSIWPARADREDAWKRFRRFLGKPAAPPRKYAKYPLENKLYHGVVMLTGLAGIATGVCMMWRVRTIFFPRNPYLFSDMTWGLMYVLHGLAWFVFFKPSIRFLLLLVRARKLPTHQL